MLRNMSLKSIVARQDSNIKHIVEIAKNEQNIFPQTNFLLAKQLQNMVRAYIL